MCNIVSPIWSVMIAPTMMISCNRNSNSPPRTKLKISSALASREGRVRGSILIRRLDQARSRIEVPCRSHFFYWVPNRKLARRSSESSEARPLCRPLAPGKDIELRSHASVSCIALARVALWTSCYTGMQTSMIGDSGSG